MISATPWSWVKTKIDNHWKPGRLGTGYQRFTLFVSKLLKFDILLIRMSEGIEVPAHYDSVPEELQAVGFWVHRRFNIILKQPKKGGKFYVEFDGEQKPTNKRINYFSPSHAKHGVTKIEDGERLVLSFGWLNR